MLAAKRKGVGENKAWGDQSLERVNETLAVGVTSNICVRRSSGHFRKALSGLGRGGMEEEGTRAGHGQQAPLSVGQEEPGLSLRHPLLPTEKRGVGSLQRRPAGLSGVPPHGCLLKLGWAVLPSL